MDSTAWADRSRLRYACILALVGVTAGCAEPAGDGSTPDPWAKDLSLARAVDLDPDAHIFEMNLDARRGEWEYAPGKTVHAMTYNGSVPGPLLEVHVGDQVIVHFSKHLDEPTTVHWHGVRVPANMDGSSMAQEPVLPGGTFDYRFQILDAGTFWYHPHEDEPVQIQHGLYGPIIVRGDDEPAVDHEGVVMLSDLLIGPDGQIAPPGDLLEQHCGREGDILLVNGRHGVVVPMRSGERRGPASRCRT